MEVCDEISRLFNYTQNSTTSAATLRYLVALKSGKEYLYDGSQQDTVEFLRTLLHEIDKEISETNLDAKAVLEKFWGLEKNEK